MKYRVLGIGILLALCANLALAQAEGIDVELNKLKQQDNACRAYLVTQNLTETDFDSLQLDVVMFDDDGIVAKRLVVEIAPLPQGKTSLKAFDIDGLPCDKIGQLLLNDVVQCRDTDGPHENCLSLVHVSSRADVSFIN